MCSKLGPKFNLGFHHPCHRNENPAERSELQTVKASLFLLHSYRIVWEIEEDGVCVSFLWGSQLKKKACSLPGGFSDAHKPKVGRQSDPACSVAQGQQASYGQTWERFVFLFHHLTQALEAIGRIWDLELLCFVLTISSAFK